MSPPAGADGGAVTPAVLRSWPLPRPGATADKHDRGTVLVVGGSAATPGAVLLAGLAALRVGAGRLQLVTSRETAAALGTAVPEAMVVGLTALDAGAAAEIGRRAESCDAVVLGPGLLDGDDLVSAVLPRLDPQKTVVDAGALHALREPGSAAVLTPNAGELSSLLGREVEEDPAGAGEAAGRYRATVVVRGAVAAPDGRLWTCAHGCPGLGTSGSGDVLAGIVGGLLARGAPPEQAGVWGQYLHAVAGERLAARLGELGFLARELLDELPLVQASVTD